LNTLLLWKFQTCKSVSFYLLTCIVTLGVFEGDDWRQWKCYRESAVWSVRTWQQEAAGIRQLITCWWLQW